MIAKHTSTFIEKNNNEKGSIIHKISNTYIFQVNKKWVPFGNEAHILNTDCGLQLVPVTVGKSRKLNEPENVPRWKRQPPNCRHSSHHRCPALTSDKHYLLPQHTRARAIFTPVRSDEFLTAYKNELHRTVPNTLQCTMFSNPHDDVTR